jgi:hypothetical protein
MSQQQVDNGSSNNINNNNNNNNVGQKFLCATENVWWESIKKRNKQHIYPLEQVRKYDAS